jgi:FKBP-type peptidyl-prolyl cis-trans isomerase
VIERALPTVLLTATLLAACESTTEPAFEVIETSTFGSSLGIVLADFTKLPSGVYMREDSVGTGTVFAAGDSVSVDHTAWLRNGALINSGPFQIDTDRLIPGFRIGMEGMAEGDTRTLIVPPALGYGSNPPFGSPIPAGAILVFEVDLIDVF